MNTPEVIEHLLSIGFEKKIGEWRAIWGQGDGFYYRCHLEREGEIIINDRDTTSCDLTWNGLKKPESFFFELKK